MCFFLCHAAFSAKLELFLLKCSVTHICIQAVKNISILVLDVWENEQFSTKIEKKKSFCSYSANRKPVGFIILGTPFNILCLPKRKFVILIIYVINASALDEGISYSSVKCQAWEKLGLPNAVWRKDLSNQISICFDNYVDQESGGSGLCDLRINKGRKC